MEPVTCVILALALVSSLSGPFLCCCYHCSVCVPVCSLPLPWLDVQAACGIPELCAVVIAPCWWHFSTPCQNPNLLTCLNNSFPMTQFLHWEKCNMYVFIIFKHSYIEMQTVLVVQALFALLFQKRHLKGFSVYIKHKYAIVCTKSFKF